MHKQAAYRAGRQEALTQLGLLKTARRRKSYAPGIPKRHTSALPTVDTTPLTWTMAVQDHNANRARRHFDLRLVDPDAGKAHSWAIPKARLPEPGEKLLAVQTWTHSPEYALHFGEHKEERIPSGYGAGTVRMHRKEPVQILEANSNLVRFSANNGQRKDDFLLRKTHGDKWLLINTTKTK